MPITRRRVRPAPRSLCRPGILITGASVIVSEVTYTYSTPIGQFVTNGMTVTDKFYERPRRVAVIPRV